MAEDDRADAAHRRGHEELRCGQDHGGRYIPAEAIGALADTATAPETAAPAAAWYPGGGEIGRQVRDFRTGHLTLLDLASAFRNRTWPSIPRNRALELSATRDAIDDPEPLIADTFDDAVPAFDCGLSLQPTTRSYPWRPPRQSDDAAL